MKRESTRPTVSGTVHIAHARKVRSMDYVCAAYVMEDRSDPACFTKKVITAVACSDVSAEYAEQEALRSIYQDNLRNPPNMPIVRAPRKISRDAAFNMQF